MSNDFEVGQRYPLTAQEARKVLLNGWPAVRGEPDLSRGRRFLGAPCDWEFWMLDGCKVHFTFSPASGFCISQSREPDPERPEPLETKR